MNVHSAPLGIFDSGLGGLSVAREVRRLLPAEQLIYLADSAFCPYGTKPVEFIRKRTLALTRALEDRGCKLLVLACNTACAAALDEVRAAVSIPVIGLEPAVKPAAAVTRTGRIGVLTTPSTAQSARLRLLIDHHRGGAEVHVVACAGLVELVERGLTGGPEVEAALHSFLDPLLERRVDVIVLGCTHYPFLRSAICRIVGNDVIVLDSGEAIAKRTLAVLTERSLLNRDGRGGLELHTSGDGGQLHATAGILLASALETGPGFAAG